MREVAVWKGTHRQFARRAAVGLWLLGGAAPELAADTILKRDNT